MQLEGTLLIVFVYSEGRKGGRPGVIIEKEFLKELVIKNKIPLTNVSEMLGVDRKTVSKSVRYHGLRKEVIRVGMQLECIVGVVVT